MAPHVAETMRLRLGSHPAGLKRTGLHDIEGFELLSITSARGRLGEPPLQLALNTVVTDYLLHLYHLANKWNKSKRTKATALVSQLGFHRLARSSKLLSAKTLSERPLQTPKVESSYSVSTFPEDKKLTEYLMEKAVNGNAGHDDVDLDREWQEAWKAAQQNFLKTHGKNLDAPTNQTPEDVLDMINNQKKRDDEDSAKYAKAKTVLGNTLTVITTLGAIAAQGAGMVFGPATMCFNAVSFLINAGANYKKIFSDLIDLFGEVSSFLDRFKIYQRIGHLIDKALKAVIHDALLSFVRVCEVGVTVLKHKVKLFLSSLLFLKDGGVMGELTTLKAIADRESKLRETLSHEAIKLMQVYLKETGQTVVEIKDGVTEVQTTTKRIDEKITAQGEEMTEVKITTKKTAIDTKKLLEETKKVSENLLEKKLTEEEKEQNKKVKNLLGQKEDFPSDIYDDGIDKKIAGTGEWILANEMYKSWADRETQADYLLCLQGEEDFGKTFAAFNAIQNLKSQSQPDMTSTFRVSIARYFFTRDSNFQSVRKALKSLAWQISQSESVFRRRLLLVSRLDDAVDVSGLWDKLFDQDSISDTMIFLIIDGIDHLDAEQDDFRQLLAHVNEKLADPNHKRLKIRILLTTTSQSDQSIIKAGINRSYSAIDMTESNTTDMELFIQKELNKIKIFKNESPQVTELKKEVVTGLMAIEKKNYTYLDFLLKSISKKSVRSEITALIERAKQGGGIEESIKEEVKRCNASLSPYEKLELNEMLLWVMYSSRSLTVAELEAVLYLTRTEPSFQDLHDQIAEKYSAFFTIKNQDEEGDRRSAEVQLVSEHIAKYFEKASADLREGSDSQEGGVNKSEVQILKKFLSSVCDDELYYKFGFEEFFHKKLQDSGVNKTEVKLVKKYLSTVCDDELYARIGFEEFFTRKLSDSSLVGDLDIESHSIRLALICLKALCDPGDSAKELHYYAREYFQSHLNEVNPSTVRLDIKVEAVQYLIRVFTDHDIIKNWWYFGSSRVRVEEWLSSDEKSNSILAWFQDVDVLRKINRSDHDWLKSLSKSDPGVDLLRPLMKWVSKTLLNDRDWPSYWREELCAGVWAFMNKVENSQDSEISRLKSYDSDFNTAQILKIIAWAKKDSGVKEDYAYYLCVGETWRCFDIWSEALNAYQQALNVEGNSNPWQAKFDLIGCYVRLKDYEKVIEHATELKNGIDDGTYKPTDAKETKEDVSLRLASAFEKTKQLDKAFELYQFIWKERPDNYYAMWAIALILTQRERFEELTGLFLDLKQDSDTETLLDRLSTSCSDSTSVDELARLAATLRKTGAALDTVTENCKHTLKVIEDKKLAATTPEDKKKWSLKLDEARYVYGAMLINFGNSEEALTEGIEMLESVFPEGKFPSNSYEYYLWRSIYSLSDAYLMQAKSAPDDKELCNRNISRLQKFSDSAFLEWGIEKPQQILGRIYSQLNQPQEARNSLRRMMKVGFDYLSDADEENDWEGYFKLAQCLMLVGDKENALAAWLLVGQTSNPTTLDVGSEPVVSTSTELTGRTIGYCDGCYTQFKCANDFWACCDCGDVHFCPSCLDMLKQDELERLVCSKDHDFLHIPPWDTKKAAELPAKHVRISEDNIVPTEEWMKTLKTEWDLL